MGTPLPDKTGQKTGVSMRAACSRLMGWNTTQTIISHYPSFVNTYDIWCVVNILMMYVLCPPLSYVLLENRTGIGGHSGGWPLSVRLSL